MSLITEWEETKKSRLDAEKAEKAAFARVLASLGDAEGMRLADGREVTYFFQNGAATIDRELLSTKYPAIYQEVSRKNQFRVCRIRKGQ
jgi:plasmid stabilization system protein ParE